MLTLVFVLFTVKFVKNLKFSGTLIAICIYKYKMRNMTDECNPVKFSWFLGSYCLIYTFFFSSCDDTLNMRINVEVMFKNSESLLSQPTTNTAEPNIWSRHLFESISTVTFRHLTWKSLSSLRTIAVSTEVLYWLAKYIIQVLLESAGRKLGTRLVLCFERNTVVTHVNKDTIPDLAEASPKMGEALKNRTHLYTNRSKYIENTFTRV